MSAAEPRAILCDTPGGCTCGAPATTPRGMHHADCAIRRPAEPRDTAEKDAARCGCCDSPLVNGVCPTRWIDNDGEECLSCVTPSGSDEGADQ